MMTKTHFAFSVLLLAFTHPTLSGEAQLSQQYSTCMNQPDSTTVSMIDCMAAETKQQDARLNKAYKELMGTLSAERKKDLRTAQRLWIKYRDANCSFYYDPNGGSMARISANDCIMNSTAERAKELELFFNEY